MNNNRQSNVLKGALILTIAAFVSKVLSAFYRIPLQNLTGDFGFYVYQQIYPFIGTVMILSLYSFPSAISTLSVSMQKKQKELSLFSFYIPIFLILFVLNGTLFLLLFFFSGELSNFIGDANLKLAFQMIAFSFLLTPVVSIIRGAFQAYGEMKPTAYSQLIEQFVRVTIIISMSYIIFTRELSVYTIGTFGAIATLIGLVASLLLLLYLFIKYRPYTSHTFKVPWIFYIRTILMLGFVAALNHMTLIMIQFADVLTLIPALVDYGYSITEAKHMKGIFDRGQPLIQFGTIIGSSFALALIPAVSHDRLNKSNIVNALVVSFYIAVGAVIGLVVLMPEINILLFKENVETVSLQILVSSILLTSIILTANAVLQGSGYMIRTAIYIFSILGLKLLLNIWLIPIWGLVGSAVATVISLLVLATMSLIGIKRNVYQFNIFTIIKWWQFFVSILSMVLFLMIFKYIFHALLDESRLYLLIYILFLVTVGAFIYLFMLVYLNVLSDEQLTVLPGGQYLIKWRQRN